MKNATILAALVAVTSTITSAESISDEDIAEYCNLSAEMSDILSQTAEVRGVSVFNLGSVRDNPEDPFTMEAAIAAAEASIRGYGPAEVYSFAFDYCKRQFEAKE
jgi:hypothetical protein